MSNYNTVKQSVVHLAPRSWGLAGKTRVVWLLATYTFGYRRQTTRIKTQDIIIKVQIKKSLCSSTYQSATFHFDVSVRICCIFYVLLGHGFP